MRFVGAKWFWDWGNAGDWYDSKGKPILAWKQKLLTLNSYGEKDEVNRNNSGSGVIQHPKGYQPTADDDDIPDGFF